MKLNPLLLLGASFLLAAAAFAQPAESGFTPLFNGKNFDGWKLMGKRGDGYGITNGILYCAKNGGGNLLTEKAYGDFVFRFEFKLESGGNNGVGIRTPIDAHAASQGMEIQILDDTSPRYTDLRPAQYHGSIYDVVPAKRGALRPLGQWNQEEITALGRHIKVVLNGATIVDADLNQITDPALLAKHPGLLRDSGHVGFLGHDEYVQFRNIRIKEIPTTLPGNSPPEGFVALFNGRDLAGWKGQLASPNDNPARRAQLAPDQPASLQTQADADMRAHWIVVDGALEFDGKGRSLCTSKDYANFELLVDWKILPKGDSGIYLRGSPQVQIWEPADPTYNPKREGSGGLYNNQKNPNSPLKTVDRPVGQWNRFRILMQGEKVTVFLNGELVVHNVTMENYWERNKPIYPTGQIELQNHGNKLWFKNIFIRELPL